MPYQAVIFDLDGTLLDTEPLTSRAINEALRPFGAFMSPEIKAPIIGMRDVDWSNYLVKKLNLVDKLTPEDLLRESHRYLHELLKTVEALPGADALTSLLDLRHIWQNVATSSSLQEVSQKRMNHADLFSRFKSITTGDDKDLKNGKPAPDIFLLSASRDGIDPSNCIVFEDSLNGVKAAKAAGMTAIAVPQGNVPHDMFEHADYILDSLNDFKLEDFGFSD